MARTTKQTVQKDLQTTQADAERAADSAATTARDAATLARKTARQTVEGVRKDLTDAVDSGRETVQTVFHAGLGALALAEEEGSKLFKKLVKKGQKVNVPDLGAARVKQLREQLDQTTDDAVDAVKGRVADARYVAGETADKVEDRVQDAVATVMKRIGVPTREEIAELTASVERLTAHIETLREQRAAAPAPAAASYEAVGGGWYEIRVGDVVVEKVQGKDDAEAAVARLAAQA